ncbi:hypothetical protein [Phenylobacterium sp.]|uniref:hypothetical protein n=1 Tax=Phenylobacterium sp. TaxID=1871053 RepID=UPI00391A1A1C
MDDIHGSLAEPGPLDAEAFASHEAVALAGFIRLMRPNCLNRPRQGGVCAYVMSLPEQWAILGKARLPHSSWRLLPPGAAPAAGEVAVVRLFDPELRLGDDPDADGDGLPTIAAGAPAGAWVSCAFAGDTFALLRQDGDGLTPVEPPAGARTELAALVAEVRAAMNLDYGEILFSFLGAPVIWSVSPFLPLHHLEAPHGERLVEAVADLLVA